MNRIAVNKKNEQSTSVAAALDSFAAAMNEVLDTLLPLPEGGERRVVEAMRYASLDGGKRLRPFLVIESAALFDVGKVNALRAAAALEMVHCYSLVHDDLPAMDDDDLRRGRPVTHKAYGEATAILAGDGLLTQAFAVLADPATHEDPSVRLSLVSTLAHAAGPSGMVGGQMLDLLAEKAPVQSSDVERMQSMKTGKLLTAACEFGAILGGATQKQKQSLTLLAPIWVGLFRLSTICLISSDPPKQPVRPREKTRRPEKPLLFPCTVPNVLGHRRKPWHIKLLRLWLCLDQQPIRSARSRLLSLIGKCSRPSYWLDCKQGL